MVPRRVQRGPQPANRGKELNCGCPNGWVRVLPSTVSMPQRMTPSDAAMFAVIGTWMEADVIEATVYNCFANGCTQVYIVDNDSPDDTCKRAESAGAVVAKVYKTDFYDDDQRLRMMNDVMAKITATSKLPELWWLSLDADEFPCGPNGQRLLDFVRHLDPQYNCVGGDAIDLYPTDPPHYTRCCHPADCMAKGVRRASTPGAFCRTGHWKHPLLRYRAGDFNLAQSRGSHVPYSPKLEHDGRIQVLEPAEEMIIFHAPFREREATEARLRALCAKQSALAGHHRSASDDLSTGSNGAIKRWRSLADVYAKRWDRVELPHSQAYSKHGLVGIALYPWRRLLKTVLNIPRWYVVPVAEVKIGLPVVGAVK